jgi:glutaredoxin
MPPITIYTKGWCPYCSAAKKLLDDKGAAFTEIDIEKKPEARAEMIQKAKGRSMERCTFDRLAQIEFVAQQSRSGKY